jgi:hypothetical protein
MNFLKPKVGSKEIIEQMNTLAILNDGNTFGGAYGQFVNDYRGLTQISHGGADAGYRTYFSRFPEQEFAVSVFSNLASSNPGGLALQVADLYLEPHYDEPDDKGTPEEVEYITLDNKILESFTGDYWFEEGAYSRKIYLKDDTLRYSRGEGNESSLAPVNEKEFKMLNVGVDVKVIFEDADKEVKTMIVIVNGGDPFRHHSYAPARYSKTELDQFTGTFYSEELSTSYTLYVKDTCLIAVHPRLSDITLKPVKPDLFSGDMWFFGTMEFIRDMNGTVSGMLVSSGRVRNLQFRKTD